MTEYQINGCRIINGDSAVILKSFPEDYIDLTVTSPPYDNLRTYKGFTFDFETIAKELYRVTKPGGVLVWVVGDATIDGSETFTSFKQALYFKEIGFKAHDTMIYKKNSIAYPEVVRYCQSFEYMFVFSKGKPKTVNLLNDRKNIWVGAKHNQLCERQIDGSIKIKNKNIIIKEYGIRYNVWEYSPGAGKSYKEKFVRNHPAVFPEALARDHILSWSREGDIVLDPFAGSGTTLKMAIKYNRIPIGIEISEEYIDIIKKRLSIIDTNIFTNTN